MQALDGVGRTVLAKTKIKSDDRAHQQQTAATSLIAQSTVRKKKTIQEITDVEIETPLLVEGELSVGADEQLNYNNDEQNEGITKIIEDCSKAVFYDLFFAKIQNSQ